jgi:hypothetical protein
MRRGLTFVPFVATCFILSSLLFLALPSAGQQGGPTTRPDIGASPVRNLSVNGMVSDAGTHARLDGVRVELHSFGGGVIETAFSSGNGTFQMNNIPRGNYTLVADQVGYETFNQQVEVNDVPVYGVQVELLKSPNGSTPVNKGASTVSKRELSIPHKAHDDMEKGLALLYGKSDSQGSLKPFERAVQEYPDYYEAYAQIGFAYMKLADTDNSEKAFRKSIEVSQERYAPAYMGLAELLLNGKRFADAEPVARKALEIDSNSWQADSELARTLIELRRPSEAEPSAVAAAALKPDNPNLYLILANIHMQLQNGHALLDDLNHYLKLAPAGPFADQARLQRDKVQQALAASETSPAAPSSSQP